MLYFFSSASSWGVASILPWIVYLAMGFIQLLYFSRKSSGGGVARASYLCRSVKESAHSWPLQLCEPSQCIRPDVVWFEGF